MSEILTTDSVAPEHRLAYWTDMICKTTVSYTHLTLPTKRIV